MIAFKVGVVIEGRGRDPTSKVSSVCELGSKLGYKVVIELRGQKLGRRWVARSKDMVGGGL